MLSRRRLPLLVAFPALYVGVAAIRAGHARPSAWILVAIAVAVALAYGRVPESMDDGAARRRLWIATGLSITIATVALTTRPTWSAIAREVASLLAMLAAIRSIQDTDGGVGLAPKATEASAPPGFGPRAMTRAAVVATLLTWATAIIDDAIALLTDAPDESAHGGATALAAGAGWIAIVVLGTTALLVAGARRLELVVFPKALACAGAAASGLVVAVALAWTTAIPSDTAAALGGVTASALIVRLASTEDALALARGGRRTLTLILFGGPIAVLSELATHDKISGTSGAAFALAVVAIVVGAMSKKLEEPFLPAKGVLLEALAGAREAARERDARTAMAHALVRIREACAVGLGPVAAPSPELWLLHPTRVLTVNAAGYLEERDAELPRGIFDVALGEPSATLRTSVLRALEVRRSDLRPLLAWLDQRDAIFATVIAESEDPDGLVVVPAGARTQELTLEEVRAAKNFADAFVAVSQATSARERHLARERDLRERIDTLEDEAAHLRHTIDLEVGRHALATTRLARPATVGIYSAASRMAYEALERRIGQDAPTVIVARAGIDPVPYVARAHLSGPRRAAPFVVVDATSSREHDLARWSDERTSPLALADRGLLLLVDGAALPWDIQVLIARAIAERRPPWERATPLDFSIALSSTAPLEELTESGRFAPELASRFETASAIVLPGLRDRTEDLHSIVADRLAREGLRVHGRPIGIDDGAYSRLVEHSFDGEDAELASIVTQLVARVKGDVIRVADVDAIGLRPPAPPAIEEWSGRRSPEPRRDSSADG